MANTIYIILALLFAVGAMGVAVVDARTQTIPPISHLWFLGIGIIYRIAMSFEIGARTWIDGVIGLFIISVPLLIISLVIDGAFGGGDIKMTFAWGLFLGWKLNALAFVLGLFAGGLYGIYLLATKKKDKKDHFAFGPFLVFGAIIAMICGEKIISWYLSLIML